MSIMDFALSKENIQPLRQGRNVQQLEMALQAQNDPELQIQLQQQKQEFENLIKNYEGDDPLQNYYDYLMWIEQAYPKNGHEGNSASVLEHCLGKFEDDSRYSNDIRFCRLWIKYIDLFPNPLELYSMMKSKDLCNGCADFYKAWAYYFEAIGDFAQANKIFILGKKMLAQPYDELDNAHKNLITAAGEYMIYGANTHRLNEKREALVSLKIFGGSGRAGTGNSRKITVTGPSHRIEHNTGNNIQTVIFEDQAQGSSNNIGIYEDGAAPKSIITVAKRQEVAKENCLKPGPWVTVPDKKRVRTEANRPAAPTFAILEDNSDEMSKCLPSDIPKTCLENLSSWITPLVLGPLHDTPNLCFGYPKDCVYGQENVEYSIEEIRALRYQPKEIIDQNAMETTPAVCAINNSSPTKISIISPWKTHVDHQNFLQDVFSKSNETRLSAKLTKSPRTNLLNDESEAENSIQSSFRLNFDSSQEVLNNNQQQKSASSGKMNFVVFSEQSPISQEDPPHPKLAKANARKTVFRTLNADEVETGSRGGMDIATTAQPTDEARRKNHFIEFPDSSSSSASYEDAAEQIDNVQEEDTLLNTQQFNFNLNVMKVSTPQNKTDFLRTNVNENDLLSSKKMLFTDSKCNSKENKILSTIVEEKSGYTSSSASSGTTKSSLYGHANKIATISEEHSSNLEENMKANEELRRSLLGTFMKDVLPSSCIESESPCTEIPMDSNNYSDDDVPENPFDPQLIQSLLKRVSFPSGRHNSGYVKISFSKPIIRKHPTIIGTDKYFLEKVLGKGQYGTVYQALSIPSTNISSRVALKYQEPANKWEFYISRELQERLNGHNLQNRFMDISIGYFCSKASILVSEYLPFGSLLDAGNRLNTLSSGKSKEIVCIYLTLEMLKIVKAMHEVKIIHADIKPDNFLIQFLSDNSLSLKLIDFGCSIDMSLFPSGTTFTQPISTESFICCEVRDGRPWSYHTDLFCIAASAHVLLFHRYMELEKINYSGIWNITSRLPRTVNQTLWNRFFNNLLNQQRGPANLTPLEFLFEEEINLRRSDLNIQLNSLINSLRKR